MERWWKYKMKNRNEKFDELMQEAYMKAIKYRQLYRLRILKARREVENGKQKTL